MGYRKPNKQALYQFALSKARAQPDEQLAGASGAAWRKVHGAVKRHTKRTAKNLTPQDIDDVVAKALRTARGEIK